MKKDKSTLLPNSDVQRFQALAAHDEPFYVLCEIDIAIMHKEQTLEIVRKRNSLAGMAGTRARMAAQAIFGRFAYGVVRLCGVDAQYCPGGLGDEIRASKQARADALHELRDFRKNIRPVKRELLQRARATSPKP